MADTKITQLRNLMTPLVHYFTMINNKECSDKAVRLIKQDEQQAILNLPKIREILAEIPDDACEKHNVTSTKHNKTACVICKKPAHPGYDLCFEHLVSNTQNPTLH